MEDELIHDLAPAYALDALDPEEERAFERHLAGCPQCRETVAELSETATALAFAALAAAPPPALRGRIAAAVEAERSNVVPLRPRWAAAAVAVAAVAACVAVGLGIWGAHLHSELHSPSQLRALPMTGARGSVVVGRGGAAALVVAGLDAAPAGKTYELWVLRGAAARPAGLFAGGAGTTTVRLRAPVSGGDRVGVTIEPAGGSKRPTSAPLFTSAVA
jgi:anti-sigma-K factor RskA